MPPSRRTTRSPRPDAATSSALPFAGDDARSASAPLRLFRIVPASKVDGAFRMANGSHEGRWSSAPTPVIYASLSAACALLEFLAHLKSPPQEPLHLVEAVAPAGSMMEVGPLPQDWSDQPYRAHVQAIGDAWAEAGVSLLLRVPSVLSPRECNALINARHDAIEKIERVSDEIVVIDSRLHGVFAT